MVKLIAVVVEKQIAKYLGTIFYSIGIHLSWLNIMLFIENLPLYHCTYQLDWAATLILPNYLLFLTV